MDAKEQIKKTLIEIINDIAPFKVEPVLETPSNPENGDYSSNFAMQALKQIKTNIKGMYSRQTPLRVGGTNPMGVAEYIKQQYLKTNDKNIKDIQVAKPGFLNFYLSDKYLFQNLEKVNSEKDEYGKGNLFENRKVMVEFTDPNPLKEFHIGHLYSNTVGESLARLFEYQKADVWRVCYQGDVGLHVAKALFGILKRKEEFEKLENEPLSVRSKFLGETYAVGARAYEADETAKKEIESLNKKVYEKNSEIYPIYEKAKKWSLEYFDDIYKKLGTEFKRLYFESEAGEKGLEIVKKHIGDIFIEDQDSVIFTKEKSGLHTRVFINSQGLPTYEAKELGLAPTKYQDFPYDLSVIVTGNEINEYFKVLLKALSMIEPELAEKTKHISHGMVRLPSGKMSSRTGDVVTGEWLLNETERKIKEAYGQMSGEALTKIAVSAIKYALLKSNIGGDVTFSFEESINLNGNSGPYIQYTYVRTQSVLSKAAEKGMEIGKSGPNTEEEAVLRSLTKFKEVALSAGKTYSPNLVANYLFDLSQRYNLFYQKHKIIGSQNQDFRLSLTQAVGQILKTGLHLLGIETVEEM